MKKKANRVWLNTEKSMRAHVMWHVSAPYGDYIDAEFCVGDCFRNATIDCSYENLRDRTAAIAKIDKLVAELAKFQAALKASPVPKKKTK